MQASTTRATTIGHIDVKPCNSLAFRGEYPSLSAYIKMLPKLDLAQISSICAYHVISGYRH